MTEKQAAPKVTTIPAEMLDVYALYEYDARPADATCAYRLLVRVTPGQIGYTGVMGEFGHLARRYLLDRALSGRRTRRPHVRTRRHVHGPRPRGRFGFWGPVPYYTTRTRRGSEVSAGGCGCCLPIPLIGALGAFGALRALARRLRSRNVLHKPQGVVV